MISGPIGHWLFASFAIVYAFLRKGIKDRDNSIPSSNSGGWKRSHECETDTHVTRRCLECFESTESTVSRSSLCTNKKSAVHGERRNSGAFHAIVPLAPLDEPFFPRSVSAQSLFISLSLCYPPIDTKFVKEE